MMIIISKIIITDTNIITDLNVANLLSNFIDLDNTYICDTIKDDELNFKTGNMNIISKFKVIKSTSQQLNEVNILSKNKNGLSPCDLLNFIVARDGNYILATGDNKLRIYAESNGITVIRTLKIIKLMVRNNIISKKEAINGCKRLIENEKTRIPQKDIENLINEIEKETIQI